VARGRAVFSVSGAAHDVTLEGIASLGVKRGTARNQFRGPKDAQADLRSRDASPIGRTTESAQGEGFKFSSTLRTPPLISTITNATAATEGWQHFASVARGRMMQLGLNIHVIASFGCLSGGR